MEATGEGKHAPNSDGEDTLHVVAPEYVIFGPDRVRMICPKCRILVWRGKRGHGVASCCRDPGIDRKMVDGRKESILAWVLCGILWLWTICSGCAG